MSDISSAPAPGGTTPAHPDPLYVSYADCQALLSVADTMRICEEVFCMHARGSVSPPIPPAFKLDDDEFNNHWHVKGVLLKEIPVTGVRFYNYYDDGERNNVGGLDCNRYVMLSDPRTGHALAMVDEHLSYGWRSAAAAVVPCKWLGPVCSDTLALIGLGSMGTSALQCLSSLYRFKEIRVCSRRAAPREEFARYWSEKLGVTVVPVASPEQAIRGADIVVGGTTSSDVIIFEEWIKPGALVISLARRHFEPAGFAKMDKVIVDDWDLNIRNRYFKQMVDEGLFSREQLHADISQLAVGAKPGREHDDERILVHTTGLVSQDVAICHWIYQQAKAQGRGLALPAARGGA